MFSSKSVTPAAEWIRQAHLTAPNAGADNFFGIAVDISGDTLVVGSPGEASALSGVSVTTPTDATSPNTGAAYVFGELSRCAAGWRGVGAGG